MAAFPLAVPYLLTPAGIVVLVTASAEASTVAVLAVVVGVLIVILALDVVVFRWAVHVSNHLDASRMLVTEKVLGFLLAALAVQLVLNGLSDVGVIHLTSPLKADLEGSGPRAVFAGQITLFGWAGRRKAAAR